MCDSCYIDYDAEEIEALRDELREVHQWFKEFAEEIGYDAWVAFQDRFGEIGD